jgi:hypothetical protein
MDVQTICEGVLDCLPGVQQVDFLLVRSSQAAHHHESSRLEVIIFLFLLPLCLPLLIPPINL